MKEFETLKGFSYVATAKTDTTISDANGLNRVVKAGEQLGFVATGGKVQYEGDCLIVQVRGNFNLPPAGGGGGGQPVTPVPEPLGTTTTLLHGHVYTLAVSTDTDLSSLGVELYGTAELWIDYTAGSVTWPAWLWLDGAAPTLEASNRYRLAFRNEGESTVARVTYNYTTPAQS